MTKKLYRSQTDRKLFGLCGGLSDLLGVDSTLLRLIVIATTFFTGGALILIYFIAAMVIPKEPTFQSPMMSGWNSYGATDFAAGPAYSTARPSATYPAQGNNAVFTRPAPSEKAHLDTVMEDIEKKAMWKEIQELKTKLSQYEKGEV
ncbi:PspC domain-containing protein [Paenibacillus sp. HJGM_3]|uniref:PspC domain-containing protein n=1 Tax=Paenibacillus sp. HJGM_3 TaxID=3379816 RepID=UPI00385C3917